MDENNYFKFELCSYPLCLFDNDCFLREAEKHELAKITNVANFNPHSAKIPTESHERIAYVLDGGSLLHKL